jgi:hypothetical protein
MGMDVAQHFERIWTSSLVMMCCVRSPEPVEIEKLQIASTFFDSHRLPPPTSLNMGKYLKTFFTWKRVIFAYFRSLTYYFPNYNSERPVSLFRWYNPHTYPTWIYHFSSSVPSYLEHHDVPRNDRDATSYHLVNWPSLPFLDFGIRAACVATW